MKTGVLIVGAGPSGLTAANLLARYGIDFIIIDNESSPTDQSRAAIVHVRTLELWDKLGLASKAVSEGLKITDVRIRERGKHLADLPLTSPEHELETPFPYALAYPQSNTEQLLNGGLEDFGKRVKWNTEFLELSQTDDEVCAVVRRPNGKENIIKACWLIGADGAKSPVRHALNLSFEGSTYEQTAFLADVEMETAPEFNVINLNLNHGGFVGILPLYGGKQFRLFGALSPEFAKKVEATEGKNLRIEDLQQWFEDYFYLDTKLTKAHWTSLYRTHRRISNHFRSNRCFLIGDSAHIHSPAGGQGMNLGIGDAFNLAWKLALVARGDAQLPLLDSYETERIGIAREVLQGSDRGFELEATQDELLEWIRIHVFPLVLNVATNFKTVRNMVFKLFSQTWIAYPDSSIVEDAVPANDAPKAGERAPYGQFVDSQQHSRSLFELLRGVEHNLLLFEGLQPDADFNTLKKETQELLDRYRIASRLIEINQINRSLHGRYGAEKPLLVFIRPDGHIAYRGQPTELDRFENYLSRLYCKY